MRNSQQRDLAQKLLSPKDGTIVLAIQDTEGGKDELVGLTHIFVHQDTRDAVISLVILNPSYRRYTERWMIESLLAAVEYACSNFTPENIYLHISSKHDELLKTCLEMGFKRTDTKYDTDRAGETIYSMCLKVTNEMKPN